MTEKKGILFDMDGTLLDSQEEVAMKKIFHAFSKEDQQLIQHLLQQNVNSYADFERLLAKRVPEQKANTISKTIETVLSHHYKDVVPIPHAKEFLDYAKAKNYRLCLCTNNATKLVSTILEDLQWTSYFDVILTSDDVVNGKPDPQMYLEAMHRIHLKPEECIIFEDSLVGVQAAKNANMDCVLVNKEKICACNYHIQDYQDPDLYKHL